MQLCEQVGYRLRQQDFLGRTITLKLRYSDFKTITRSRTLPAATDVTQQIWDTANDLLLHKLPARKLIVRLIGVGVSGFKSSGKQEPDANDPHDGRNPAGRQSQQMLLDCDPADSASADSASADSASADSQAADDATADGKTAACDEATTPQNRLDTIADQIRDRFGSGALSRGISRQSKSSRKTTETDFEDRE